MKKNKSVSYEQKIIDVLEKLPNPLEDKKHRIFIYFVNDRARSNEKRFEHISLKRHDLLPSDIEKLPRRIKSSVLKKDAERKGTFNLYFKRNSSGTDYIKISMELDFSKSNKGIVKTIYITKNMK